MLVEIAQRPVCINKEIVKNRSIYPVARPKGRSQSLWARWQIAQQCTSRATSRPELASFYTSPQMHNSAQRCTTRACSQPDWLRFTRHPKMHKSAQIFTTPTPPTTSLASFYTHPKMHKSAQIFTTPTHPTTSLASFYTPSQNAQVSTNLHNAAPSLDRIGFVLHVSPDAQVSTNLHNAQPTRDPNWLRFTCQPKMHKSAQNLHDAHPSLDRIGFVLCQPKMHKSAQICTTPRHPSTELASFSSPPTKPPGAAPRRPGCYHEKFLANDTSC